MVSQAVHDGVGGDSVGQGFDPVARPGLGRDPGGQAVFAVGQDREQVGGGVTVDTHGEEVVDDEQIDVGELVEQFLVGDAVGSGDDQFAGQRVHAYAGDGVAVWNAGIPIAQAR